MIDGSHNTDVMALGRISALGQSAKNGDRSACARVV